MSVGSRDHIPTVRSAGLPEYGGLWWPPHADLADVMVYGTLYEKRGVLVDDSMDRTDNSPYDLVAVVAALPWSAGVGPSGGIARCRV